MRKRLLKNFKFYCILDYTSLGAGRNIISLAKKLAAGGADIIQLRFKNMELSNFAKVITDACQISRLAKKHKIPFLINDRVDVAQAVDADGVHLGQEDLSVESARKILGKKKIIGVSCHNIKQALLAQRQGADYVSLGPVFKTPTKPKYKPVGLSLIKRAKDKLRLPFVAIGGINLNNLKDLLEAGAERIAVVRAVCSVKNIHKTIAAFKSRLNQNFSYN